MKRVRIYTKEQLAALYWPEKELEKAKKALYRRIIRNEELKKELSDMGWRITHRTLTHRQINTIIQYLGMPIGLISDEEKNTDS